MARSGRYGKSGRGREDLGSRGAAAGAPGGTRASGGSPGGSLARVDGPGEIGALAELADKARDFAKAARSANTLRAYAADWRDFSDWCEQHGERVAASHSRSRRALRRGSRGAGEGEYPHPPPLRH